MNWILFIVGLLIVKAAIIDILYTVLAPNGSGRITGLTSYWIWRGALFVTNHNGKHKFLSNLGMFLLLLIVEVWVILIWIGNTLIVYSDSEALYSSAQEAYVTDFMSKVYFSGYVLSSMGNGDYTPVGEWWQFYTAFISFTGVIFISLAISYLIPVLQAVTSKRSLAIRLQTLGRTPEELLVKNYKNDNFEYLVNELFSMKQDIIELAQKHLAYPVIHYFHSTKHYESTSLTVAKVDETLSILECILSEEDHDAETDYKIQELKVALTYLIKTLKSGYIDPREDEPEVPQLNYLNENNIPNHISVQKVKNHFNQIRERRKLLLAYVQNDAWTWNEVVNCTSELRISEDDH
jgi:hypothetical protein